MLTILGALASVGMLALDAFIHTRKGLTSVTGEQLGRDFINVWAAGRAALTGHAGLIYNLTEFARFQRSFTGEGSEWKFYSYPPTAILLELPFGVMPFLPSLVLWLAVPLLALGVLLSHALGRSARGLGAAVLAIVATPAVFLNAWAGQNGMISAVLLAGGLMALRTRPWLAGVLFGLMCFKPQLLILAPVALLAGGYWRTIAATALTVLAVTGASLVWLGPDPWLAFVHNLPEQLAIVRQSALNFRRMPTVYAMLKALQAPEVLAYAVQLVSSLAAVVALFAIWRSAAPQTVKGAAFLVAIFLGSSYAWDYDMVVLLFAAVWAWPHLANLPASRTAVGLVAAMVAYPMISPAVTTLTHVHLMPLILWGVLVQLLLLAVPAHARSLKALPAAILDLARGRPGLIAAP